VHKTFHATVNGAKILHTEEPLNLPPGTRLRVAVETLPEHMEYDQRLEQYYAANAQCAQTEELRVLRQLEGADTPLEEEDNWW